MVIGDRMMNGFLACGNMLLRLEVVSSDADREMAQGSTLRGSFDDSA